MFSEKELGNVDKIIEKAKSLLKAIVQYETVCSSRLVHVFLLMKQPYIHINSELDIGKKGKISTLQC